MTTNKTIYKQIEEQLKTAPVRNKLASWLKHANTTKEFIRSHQKDFHEWAPLKFYVTLGKRNFFSIRYKGQEVAYLIFSAEGEPRVKIINKNVFEPHEFNWRGKDGTHFRKHFKGKDYKVHSPEHLIESELISSLINSQKPSNSPLRNRTAVTLGDFPLQFPVPFSASKGTIGETTGHVDILGRKRPGVLSVWELKSPSVYKGAGRQAYIYALQVYSIINDPSIGKDWLELFGFSRKSKTPKVEIVIGVSEKFKEQVKKEISTLKKEMEEDGIEGLFSWNIASYSADLEAHKISIQAIP
jgi:hypothetical protein